MRFHSTLLAIGVALGATAVVAAPVPKEIKRNNDKILILGKWKQEFMSLRGAEKQPETINTFQFDADGKCGISYDNSPRQNDSEYSLDPTSSPGKMKWCIMRRFRRRLRLLVRISVAEHCREVGDLIEISRRS